MIKYLSIFYYHINRLSHKSGIIIIDVGTPMKVSSSVTIIILSSWCTKPCVFVVHHTRAGASKVLFTEVWPPRILCGNLGLKESRFPQRILGGALFSQMANREMVNENSDNPANPIKIRIWGLRWSGSHFYYKYYQK